MIEAESSEDVDRFLQHVDAGETRRAIDLAVDRLDQGGITAVIDGLLAPVQRQVGQRWQLGRYTVGQEHLATAVVDDVLGLLTPYVAPQRDHDNTLALVCAEGEWHATPARMAALLARDAGWRVQFLGASTPADHLRTTLIHLSPQALAVSCTLPLALPGVTTLVDAAHELELPVVAGGSAFDAAGHRAATLGADASFGDIRQALQTLEIWLDAPPASRPAADLSAAGQRLVLAQRHDEIVDRAYRWLEHRLPMMASFDDRRRRHTRQDLDYIVRFLDVALLVDDPAVFTRFVAWLVELLTARGVPAAVMDATLEAVDAQLGPDLPSAHRLLEVAREAPAGG